METFKEEIVQPSSLSSSAASSVLTSSPGMRGSGLSLKCVASGNPLPQVTWTLDGYPVPDDSRYRIGDYVTSNGLVVSYVNITEIKSQGKNLISSRMTEQNETLPPKKWSP